MVLILASVKLKFMDLIIEVLQAWGIGLLAGFTYTIVKVWKNFPGFQFNSRKFFIDNHKFWIICIMLNLALVLTLHIVPEAAALISEMGIEVTETPKGYYWLGIFLASGANNKLVKKRVQDSK
jgi:hypothetical protein